MEDIERFFFSMEDIEDIEDMEDIFLYFSP